MIRLLELFNNFTIFYLFLIYCFHGSIHTTQRKILKIEIILVRIIHISVTGVKALIENLIN